MVPDDDFITEAIQLNLKVFNINNLRKIPFDQNPKVKANFLKFSITESFSNFLPCFVSSMILQVCSQSVSVSIIEVYSVQSVA